MPGASSEVLTEPLQRFGHLDPATREGLFAQLPRSPKQARTAAEVGVSLGAVLYTPATQPQLAERLVRGYWPGLTAVVICLEDAIADEELELGQRQLDDTLRQVARQVENGRISESLPFLFVRVRSPEHLEELLLRWGPLADHLDGIVLPKVNTETATAYFSLLRSVQTSHGRPLWGLPILEGPETAYQERRLATLLELRELLVLHGDLVPGVRIGATDLSGLWGLRRTRDFTVYDLVPVANVISDVVSVLGRAGSVPAISGPVWEYVDVEPVFKPRLRVTPFVEQFGASDGRGMREEMVQGAVDGLIRETVLDRLNGLHGKTVIHPSHIPFVDAVYAVSHEEYEDALAIARAGISEGVGAATIGARMNEPKPHALWAERTLRRAEAFGVLRPEHTFLALLQPPAPVS